MNLPSAQLSVLQDMNIYAVRLQTLENRETYFSPEIQRFCLLEDFN